MVLSYLACPHASVEMFLKIYIKRITLFGLNNFSSTIPTLLQEKEQNTGNLLGPNSAIHTLNSHLSLHNPMKRFIEECNSQNEKSIL